MKTHISLSTSDLQRSVAFYRMLLDLPPTKLLEDYALFVSEDPGLELALEPTSRAGDVSATHFGIVVDSVQAVDAAIDRIQAAGLPVDVEREETCCYATQTKVWASDPDGRRWEVYYVHEDTETRNDLDTTCCSGEAEPRCCAV